MILGTKVWQPLYIVWHTFILSWIRHWIWCQSVTLCCHRLQLVALIRFCYIFHMIFILCIMHVTVELPCNTCDRWWSTNTMLQWKRRTRWVSWRVSNDRLTTATSTSSSSMPCSTKLPSLKSSGAMLCLKAFRQVTYWLTLCRCGHARPCNGLLCYGALEIWLLLLLLLLLWHIDDTY